MFLVCSRKKVTTIPHIIVDFNRGYLLCSSNHNFYGAKMQGEIISIGTELLLGEITDTNSSYIARMLTSLGIEVSYQISVGDDRDRLGELIRLSHKRSPIVITTGGLGPTVDDITRESIAEALGKGLEFRQELMDGIEAYFEKRGISLSSNNRKQAYIPEGSLAIQNPVGTAPGFIVKDEKGIIVALPGIPREMTYLLEKSVIPFLKEEFSLREGISSRVLKIGCMGESKVDEKIGDLMKNKDYPIGLLIKDGEIQIRITAKEKDQSKNLKNMKEIEKEIRRRLGSMIYGADDETLEEVVGSLLKEKKETISMADSFTGGWLAQRFLRADSNRKYFNGCLVFVNGKALTQDLNLREEKLKRVGLISRETAQIAAKEIKKRYHSEIGLAVLGGTDKSNDFTTYIALSSKDKTMVEEHKFSGILDIAKSRITTLALELMRRYLKNIGM